jgi:hypothetical protein
MMPQFNDRTMEFARSIARDLNIQMDTNGAAIRSNVNAEAISKEFFKYLASGAFPELRESEPYVYAPENSKDGREIVYYGVDAWTENFITRIEKLRDKTANAGIENAFLSAFYIKSDENYNRTILFPRMKDLSFSQVMAIREGFNILREPGEYYLELFKGNEELKREAEEIAEDYIKFLTVRTGLDYQANSAGSALSPEVFAEAYEHLQSVIDKFFKDANGKFSVNHQYMQNVKEHFEKYLIFNYGNRLEDTYNRLKPYEIVEEKDNKKVYSGVDTIGNMDVAYDLKFSRVKASMNETAMKKEAEEAKREELKSSEDVDNIDEVVEEEMKNFKTFPRFIKKEFKNKNGNTTTTIYQKIESLDENNPYVYYRQIGKVRSIPTYAGYSSLESAYDITENIVPESTEFTVFDNRPNENNEAELVLHKANENIRKGKLVILRSLNDVERSNMNQYEVVKKEGPTVTLKYLGPVISATNIAEEEADGRALRNKCNS